jgi:hypothetical protein
MKRPVLEYSSQPAVGWEPVLQRATSTASTCALALGVLSIALGFPHTLNDAKDIAGIVLEWAALCGVFGAMLSGICLLQYRRKRMRNFICLGMCLVPLGWFCFYTLRSMIWAAQGAR